MIVLGPFPSSDQIAAAVAAALSTTTVAATSAIQGSKLEIGKGDDYLARDNRALSFTFVANPALSGGSLLLAFEAIVDGSQALCVTGVVNSDTQAHFDLTAAQTATLFVGSEAYEYRIIAVLADGSTVTLMRGCVSVSE